MKRHGCIPFAEEISKQSSIDSTVWLLVFMFIKIYKERERAVQEKIQNVRFEEKREPRSGMELSPILRK